ncbi:hypothetical protein M2145_000593 [Lachnospiraceae bacterium PF1-21]|uniref:DUF3784 domain-containing protein n=1 Tax=Ohessyouella blattaphilus TaxID=2949333 RepID=A0ABT1EDG9_9FIRM|nr:hypothetical protein [Ohessyouella blattaphilus]MCP1108744.1 hypothetical protein [Ohessyouella blattaphilus]MCR8562138.1 hypothetical protein [Ohessyouella blattaphilus]MDL2249354.1 hypothetical protein [Lachnospiraceae bacterium OttesenSCG-928-J05]
MEYLSYITLFFGFYCMYIFYKLQIKRDLSANGMLPREVDPGKCKDKDGYIKGVAVPILILGVVTALYSLVDILRSRLEIPFLTPLMWALMAADLAVLVWVVFVLRKNNQKYF